jgi:hypothetical protein
MRHTHKIVRSVLSALLFAAWLSSGCLSLSTTVDWEGDTDFAAYHTFSVERARPLDSDSQELQDPARAEIVDQRAFARIRQRLTEKNLIEAPAAEADLNVKYHLASHEEVRGSEQPGHVRWLRVEIREIHYETYTHGTVVVDIADRAKNLLVWHGAVEGTVKTPDVPGKNLERAIDRLLSKYPPRWKKY